MNVFTRTEGPLLVCWTLSVEPSKRSPSGDQRNLER